MKPIRRLEWHEVAGVPHGTFKIVLLYIGLAASWLLVANGLAGWLLGGSGLGAGRIFWGGFLLIAGVALWFAWSRRRLARKRAAVSDLPSAVTLERPAISPPVGMTIGEGVWADIINQASRPLLTLPFLVLTVVITALVIIGISYTAHYGRQKEGLRLQAIADLKIDRIATWLWEREKDAQFIRSNRLFAELYGRWHDSGDMASLDQLRKQLRNYQRTYACQSILVLDENGQEMLSTEPVLPRISTHLRDTARLAMAQGQVLVTDLYHDAHDLSATHLDYVVPMQVSGNSAGGAIILRIDPSTTLYQMTQSWPFPNASGEALIFRRDGDQALYLSELRRRPGDKAQLRIPVTDKYTLGPRFLRGELKLGAVVDARDYQGVPIIGVIKAIPLTDWFLIVKLDREEMYGPAREDATWVILLGAMGLLIAAIAVFLVEQNRSLRLSVLERRQQGEKLQALQQLADQRSRLQTLFEQSRDGIVILDGSGRVSEANGHHAEMLGYSLAEMRDLSVADWDSGWRSEQGAGPTAEASRTDGHFETRYRRKDGSVFDVEVVATSVEWAGQKLMFWVCRDISERKRIEAQLRKLSLAVEQSPNSIVIMDVSGRIEYVNAAFTVISGYAPEEAPDHNPYLIGPDGTATSTHVALWQRLAQGETWQGQFQNRRKTGEEYDEFARLSPIRQPGGRLTHYLAIGEDITDKKRLAIELDRHRHHLEELVHQRTLELAAARDVAESANRAKSLFLANMSHEIRTPMNAIMGLTHLLQRSARDPDQREKLKKVGDTAHHLLQILNDILDLSKIEAGKLVLERIEFELDTVLNNVCSLVAERAKAKELELVVEIDPHLSCARVLRGDPTRLTQLLLNYLGNAVKFTERGSVTLRGRIQEENAAELLLRFEVEDTGPGIAPDVLSRLFAMFEQADGSTTRRHGGTGLGLAINQRLARLMGGEAGATSVFGVGSTFWCTVRIGKSSRPPTRRLMSANLRERRVLVVDDLPEARLALSDMLQAMGMRADIAQSGVVALSVIAAADARGEPFDVVLLDWRMPELDGLATAQRLAELTLARPPLLLLVTAYDDMELREVARQAGLHAVLAKPITPSALHNALLQVVSALPPAVIAAHSIPVAGLAVGPATVVADTPPAAISQPSQQSPRLLLAEDNPLNQEVALELLRGEGFVVDLAENGLQAVEKARETAYALILMDVQMPELDGLAAARAIRQLPGCERVPILAMTANAFSEDRARCLAAGMNEHLAKPVEPDMLLATVRHWLFGKDKRSIAVTHPPVVADSAAQPLAQLAAIPGLEPRSGLRRVNSRLDAYLRVLRHFTAAHATDLAELHRHLVAGDLSEARRLAHTLKGVAGTLGAVQLQGLVAELEAAIGVGQPLQALEPLIERASTTQNSLTAALGDVLGTSVPEVLEVETVDWRQVGPILVRLEALLVEDDVRANQVFREAAPLLHTALGAVASKLEQQLEGFEYQLALEILRGWMAAHPQVGDGPDDE